jgi:hypothetical protein
MEGSTRMEKGVPAGIDSLGQDRDAPARPALDESRENVFSLAGPRRRYGGSLAVEDVTFDLREREITAFIGPSAAASRRSSAA